MEVGAAGGQQGQCHSINQSSVWHAICFEIRKIVREHQPLRPKHQTSPPGIVLVLPISHSGPAYEPNINVMIWCWSFGFYFCLNIFSFILIRSFHILLSSPWWLLFLSCCRIQWTSAYSQFSSFWETPCYSQKICPCEDFFCTAYLKYYEENAAEAERPRSIDTWLAIGCCLERTQSKSRIYFSLICLTDKNIKKEDSGH